ncbi:MKI67 FHA domain-interacting nucleolar phosphoprotein-like [Iris pallida]|uniref:MKI67 FHA domain-interacting nucleolar phosphoprotein-like n=1 Tax=Iris pallida TaxID=29817 RepID=A0AAX6E6U9_IRIPA|nr:MKI67 FHA domain-interacting nucleolar phosphoprotein-like [Iris pallida]
MPTARPWLESSFWSSSKRSTARTCSSLGREKLSPCRVLEVSQYLENYLWPIRSRECHFRARHIHVPHGQREDGEELLGKMPH